MLGKVGSFTAHGMSKDRNVIEIQFIVKARDWRCFYNWGELMPLKKYRFTMAWNYQRHGVGAQVMIEGNFIESEK
jgi:hypothetical protein